MEYTLILILLATVLYMLVQQKKELNVFKEGLGKAITKLVQIENLLNKSGNDNVPTQESESTQTTSTAPSYEDHILQQLEEIIKEEPIAEVPSEEENTQSEKEEIIEDTIQIEEIIEEIEHAPVLEYRQEPVLEYRQESHLSNWYSKFKNDNPDIEKFIGENLINKIGILILVLGISFFVKYAIDQDWINEPSRVGIGILSGAIILTVAHKLRSKFIAFSSVLVAGAISVFYFTIGIAFHDYQLFSQTSAFAIMTAITIFAVFVSILYNRQELGVLSTIAGFAVPFMVSTGTGNYIVLLTYMAILNIGMLSISFYKRWFIVNFTALLATFIIVAGWYVTWQEPTNNMIVTAFIYCTIFYFIFIIAFTINNIIHKNKFRNYEITSTFLSTVLYYAISYHMISLVSPYLLGLFTIILGLVNMLFAYIIYKYYKFDKNIIYVFIGLSLTLATITIPIQLEGNYVTLLWASEAVVLFWLGKKSRISSFTISAILVQSLALLSTLTNVNRYSQEEIIPLLGLNVNFMTNLLVIASLIITYRLLRNNKINFTIYRSYIEMDEYPQVIFYIAIFLGYIFPMIEIANLCNIYNQAHTTMYFFLYLYHMLYTTGMICYSIRRNNSFNLLLKILTIINIVLYLGIAFKLPFDEILNNYYANTSTNLVFYLHYFSIGLLIYQSIILFKETFLKAESNRDIKSFVPWAFVFYITYLLSAETSVIFLFNTNTLSNYETVQFQVIKIAYPILWGIISFALLIYGIKKSLKPIRIIALTLLGITILKLFTYDIKDASETGKIVAFILLGVLILTISFVYQKIKKLVVDNDEK